MNNVAFESGAGTSLVHGPLVDPASAGGAAALAALVTKVQHYADASNAQGRFVFPAGTYPSNNRSGDVNPDGKGDPADNPIYVLLPRADYAALAPTWGLPPQ